MQSTQKLFLYLVLSLYPVIVFATSEKKPEWDEFKLIGCADSAKEDGSGETAPYELGFIRGWKIEVFDKFRDPHGHWQDWIVFQVSSSKTDQRICQTVAVDTIAEARVPTFKIENGLLVIRQSITDRYSPNSTERTTKYRLGRDGAFDVLSQSTINPFDELKKQFNGALKGNDLSALLRLRNKYVDWLSGGYNSGFFNSERRSLCFRSLDVATRLTNKDVAASKALFLQFVTQPAEDGPSGSSCAETYNPPAYLVTSNASEQEASPSNEDEDAETTKPLTEDCDAGAWEDCTPLSSKEILILNNAALLLQKMGQHVEAIRILRHVLKQDTRRKVAYKNLGDSLAAQKKSGSFLALLVPDVLKRNRKGLSRAEVQSIQRKTGATCEPKEMLTSSIAYRGNWIEFEFRCQPAGGETNEGRLRARWDATVDDVIVIKTLVEKKAASDCPISLLGKNKNTKAWTTIDSYRGRLPGPASKLAESCQRVAGYMQFGDCKWLIACRGDRSLPDGADDRYFSVSFVDFVIADEYDESVRRISRASGSFTNLTPIEGGVGIEETVRIKPDRVDSRSELVKIGSFNITCEGESCAETTYRCDFSESLKSLALELRPIAPRGSIPLPRSHDVKLTTFFSTKNDAPSFEPGELMGRRAYFEGGFSEEIWDAGLMRRRRLGCNESQ
jgi:hypothetical protein